MPWNSLSDISPAPVGMAPQNKAVVLSPQANYLPSKGARKKSTGGLKSDDSGAAAAVTTPKGDGGGARSSQSSRVNTESPAVVGICGRLAARASLVPYATVSRYILSAHASLVSAHASIYAISS